ncbi:MAG: hypothetical protein GWP24_02490 [Alphaproteobacteria bacterium]|nr:hypothetical protein [Alphaproteobacteria bacterium]
MASKKVQKSAEYQTHQNEQTFVDDPIQDRLLALSMALANELWVSRCRIKRLEEKLISKNLISKNDVEAIASELERSESSIELEEYSATLMEALSGLAASRSADEDILQNFK